MLYAVPICKRILRVLLAFNDYDDIVLNMVGTLPKDGKVDSFALTPHCNWELNGNLVPPISKFKNQTALYALSDVFFRSVISYLVVDEVGNLAVRNCGSLKVTALP